ncbi:MAG TPA: transglycosylase SLT domain-containing protein [Lacunisphaera sp.]|nr:transglycosylase SLT domain-containing protein [Lacunisphaera sp.]
MIRSVAALKAALAFVAAHFSPRAEAAEHLQELGRRYRVDPFTVVSVVTGESHWNPSVIGAAGEVGLGQVKPRSPEHAVALLDWRVNLTATAGALAAWREFCQKRVGSALAVYFLQGYQGYDANRGTTCGHRKVRGRWVAQPIPELTRKVLARRAELARRFG